jgi:hypothetical protein
MESLYIKATEQTPEVDFKLSGDLKIKGVSLPENIFTFYNDVVSWLAQYETSLPKNINLVLNLEYFNTASSQMLARIIKRIIGFKEIGSNVRVVWLYEKDDDDLLEEGEKLQYLVKYNFDFVEDN